MINAKWILDKANCLTAFALLSLAISGLPNFVNAQNLPASVVQLPVFGVSVDADGTLQAKMFAAPGGRLFLERARAARLALPADLFAKSDLRKVSLARLEKALQQRIETGKKPTDEMLKLAGLQRIEYVFVYPDQSDIVIAGPAEGWLADAGDRAVGITTNRPVVLLEDLLVALRLSLPSGRLIPGSVVRSIRRVKVWRNWTNSIARSRGACRHPPATKQPSRWRLACRPV